MHFTSGRYKLKGPFKTFAGHRAKICCDQCCKPVALRSGGKGVLWVLGCKSPECKGKHEDERNASAVKAAVKTRKHNARRALR